MRLRGVLVMWCACGHGAPGMPDAEAIHDGAEPDASPLPDASIEPDAPVDLTPPCMQIANPTFSVPFTDIALLDKIIPLGSVSGWEIKPHTYPEMIDSVTQIPIYAPANAQLTSIAWVDQAEFTGYTLDFRVSCTFRYRFAHIEEPIDAIRMLGPSAPGSSGGQPPSSPYAVTAGDLIGYAHAPGLDFGVYDTTHANTFADPARYNDVYGAAYYHALCPYDRYDVTTRDAFYALFGGFTSPAGSCSDCRNASMDVPGTLAGGWFIDPPSTGTAGPRLAAAADCDGTVRIGVPGLPMMITYGPDPKTISDEHCYSTADHFIYLKLVSGLLHEAHGNAPCPTVFPTTGVTVFQR